MKTLFAIAYTTIRNVKSVSFLFLITVFFYCISSIFNPSNKILLIFVTFLFIGILWKIKHIKATLLLCYLITSVISTGKRYDFIIIPPGIFPIDFYPLGYFVSVVFSPSIIIAFCMAVLIVREWIKGNLKETTLILPDILLIIGTVLRLASDIIVSPMQDIGIILWIFSLPSLVAYFYLRWICHDNKKMLIYCFSILVTLVSVESCLAIAQFLHGSPFGLSMEIQKNIELFGEAADEYAYRFRPVGTFDHANMLGAYLTIYTPILIYLLTLKTSLIKQITLFLGCIAIGLTLSRSAWIGISASLLWQGSLLLKIIKSVISKLHPISIILVCVLSCCFVGFILLPRISSSFFSFADSGGANVRNIQISIAWRLIAQSPILGTGTAMSVLKGLPIDETGLLSYFPSPVHNRYILLAVENGIPALFVYLLFLISSVVVLYRITKEGSVQKKYLWRLYAGSVTAIMLIGFFQPYSLEMNVALLFALIYNHVTKT